MKLLLSLLKSHHLPMLLVVSIPLYSLIVNIQSGIQRSASARRPTHQGLGSETNIETRRINSEYCINLLLFLWSCILMDLLEYGFPTLCFYITAHRAFQPYTLNPLRQHSSPRSYCTRRVQLQINSPAPCKSTGSHYQGNMNYFRV